MIFGLLKKTNIYVIALAKPENNKVLIKSIKDIKISRLKILGFDGKITWTKSWKGLEITLPKMSDNLLGYAVEITT